MDGLNGKKRQTLKYAAIFLILIALAALFLTLNLTIGSVSLKNAADIRDTVLWQIRLPRALLAFILGGALSVAGFLLQTYFENPLAGPYVLGISSGAKMAVALTMIFFLNRFARVSSGVLILAAFVGAFLTTLCIVLVARRTPHIATLLVVGIMIGYICSAVTEFVITFAEEQDIVNLHGWSQGSFSGADMGDVFTAAIVVLVAYCFVFILLKPIAALRLGEHYAASVGVNVRRIRIALIFASALLAATVTAFAGPISFVGIAVPVLLRRLFHTSEPRILFPACVLGGAVFCLLCDLIARTAFAPTELSISSVTAIFGAPIVIALLLKRRRRL